MGSEDKNIEVEETTNEKTPIMPITVRQLESLIRISEALTRMTLKSEITEDEVKQAIQLFEASTAQTISAGINGVLYVTKEERKELKHVIATIQQFITVNQVKSESRLVNEVLKVLN